MKILISADMEGATGAVDWDDVMPGKRQYERFRKFLTGDVCAAIKGSQDGGADDIVITEAHDGMKNIFLEDLPPDVSMITGNVGKRFGMMEGIDESFDAVFLVAYHAMEGTTAAIMNHTWSPHLIRKIWLGDTRVGELGLSANIAGHFDVPIVLVTGDDKVANEAVNLLGKIETAVVKFGVSRYTARCLTPEKTAEVIRVKAKKAVQNLGDYKPYKLDYPLEAKIELMSALQASQVSRAERFELLDPTTVKCVCDDALDVNQAFSEVFRGRDRVFGSIS